MSKMEILFEDKHIVVAVKPYGVLSEFDDKKPNMPALLKAERGYEVYPVHRLDRTTQGLILYAKTQDSARRLGVMIQNGEVQKTYLAVAEGSFELLSAELNDLLYFDRKKNKSFVVKRERKGVKTARLSYEVIGTGEVEGKAISLLKIRLFTGRTHQIRVQLASRRHPLVGDRRYGSKVACDNIMLTSAELGFVHPFSGESLNFTYVPKNDLFGAINADFS